MNIENFKQHWFVSIIIICVGVAGITWTTALHLLVGPRDFEIQRLRNENANLQQTVSRLNDKHTKDQIEMLPFVIFNNEGTVLHNQGADEYINIDNIKIRQDEKKHEKAISIQSNVFLSTPPILSTLEVSENFYEAKRVNSNTFVYIRKNTQKKIYGYEKPWDGENYIEEIKENKYKIEVVK